LLGFTDMSRWRTEKHFTAWLTLAPNNKISDQGLAVAHIAARCHDLGQVLEAG